MTKISIVSVSFLAGISMVIAFAAELFGYLRIEYAVAIIMIAFTVQAILIAIVVRKITKILSTRDIAQRASITSGEVVIPKDKFNDKYVAANNEILSQCIKPIHPWRDSIFRVMMELVPDVENRPLKFYVIRKCYKDSCEQEIDIIKPSDSSKHIFELYVDPKELINFRFSRDTIVKTFSVDELYIP